MREGERIRPDKEAMERLLARHGYDPPGIVLRLAWKEGLARREISALTWEQVDFEENLLRLPDREVPLEAETAEVLRRWKNRCERYTPHVAASDKFRRRLSTEALSMMVRRALDEEGQTGVRLADLRRDFILRQIAEHGYPYALRVSGISLSTYRVGEFREDADAPQKAKPPHGAGGDGDEDFKLWRILQTERTRPAGVALWLASRLGLRTDEIASLTWEDVDFDADVVTAGGRSVPLTVTVKHVLEDVRALRRPDDDPHVILTPKSRRPMDQARLATVTRAALIRGGIEDKTIQDFRRDAEGKAWRERLRAHLAEHGNVSVMEAAEMLDLSPGQAYARLARMRGEGELALLKGRYWPAGAAILPEEREAAVLAYVGEHGGATREEAAALLSVGMTTVGTLLRKLAAEGKLVRLKGRYYPPGAAVPRDGRKAAVLEYVAEHGPVYRRDVAERLGIGTRLAGELLRTMAGSGALELVPGTKKYALPPPMAGEGAEKEDALPTPPADAAAEKSNVSNIALP